MLMRREFTRRLTRPTSRSSFYNYLDRRRITWGALVSAVGNDSEVYPEYSKLRARELASGAGVRVPRLLDGPIGVDDLRVSDYGDRFVVKPNWGASSRGVLVVDRRPDGRFTNLVDGSSFDQHRIRQAVSDSISLHRRGSAADILVEESMARGNKLPTDWKFYTFYGRVGLILQVERHAGGSPIKVYDADWNDLGAVRNDRATDPSLPLPAEPARLLAAAEAISRSVRTGFLRVDLYESADGGAVAGEVAMLPGGDQYFGRRLDRVLGGMWDDAIVRLLLERQPLIP
jgi:hypothetical protein